MVVAAMATVQVGVALVAVLASPVTLVVEVRVRSLQVASILASSSASLGEVARLEEVEEDVHTTAKDDLSIWLKLSASLETRLVAFRATPYGPLSFIAVGTLGVGAGPYRTTCLGPSTVAMKGMATIIVPPRPSMVMDVALLAR